MRLDGRVALVTGSGQGIGKAIGTLFAERGARVVISDVVLDRAERTVEELTAAGHEAEAMHLDVADPASVGAGIDRIVERRGVLDILVNNAGIGINAPFLDFKLADFELSLKVNLTGAFICGQAAARQMVRQGAERGRLRSKIINIVSLSGQRGGMGRRDTAHRRPGWSS